MKISIENAAVLGKVVRASRKAQRIRQDDAAGSIGVSENFLAKVERGSPSVQWGKLYLVLEGLGIRVVVDVIEPLGSEVHLNVTAGKHTLVAVVDTQTIVRMHQEIELALDLNKMHLFEKDPPNLRIKTES